MAFRKDTIRVSNTAFAPVGAEIEWDVQGVTGVDNISTILLEKDTDAGTIVLCYDALALPASVGSLTESMVSNPVVTDCCGITSLVRLPIIVSAGTAPSDVSGGAAEVPLGSNIHLWSDTLAITVEKGSAIVRIENSSPYAVEVDNNIANDEDFDPRLVLPRL